MAYNRQDTDDSSMLLLMLLGCVLVVAGIIVARYSLSLIPIAEGSMDWIKTDGRITKFQIVSQLVGEYEPQQPSLAVLEPGRCVDCYPKVILGDIFVLIGIFLLRKALRKLFGGS